MPPHHSGGGTGEGFYGYRRPCGSVLPASLDPDADALRSATQKSVGRGRRTLGISLNLRHTRWRPSRTTSGTPRPHLAVVRRLAPLAEQAGCSVTQLALAWLLTLPEVVAAAVGTRNPVQAEANAAAAGMTLDEDLLLAVSALLEK
ncbi:aldo/keto reductase [Streptomyces niveus]